MTKRTILLATALILTVALGLFGYYVYAAYNTNVTVLSSGTLVPLSTGNPAPISAYSSLSVRKTNGAVINQIYWGDHLTIYDAPTYQVMIQNTGSVPLKLSMTASTPSFAKIT
jgi:hypothetical protein